MFRESYNSSRASYLSSRDAHEPLRASPNAREDALAASEDAHIFRMRDEDARTDPAPPLHGPCRIPVFSLAAASAHRLDSRQFMSPLHSILAISSHPRPAWPLDDPDFIGAEAALKWASAKAVARDLAAGLEPIVRDQTEARMTSSPNTGN